MNSPTPGRRRSATRLWTTFGLVLWTALWFGVHQLIQLDPGVALFLVTILAGLTLACAVVIRHLWIHGWRWAIGGEAARFTGWCLAGFLTVLVLFYHVELWRGQRAWHNAMESASGHVDALDPASFIPSAVPDEQNFARIEPLQALQSDDFFSATAVATQPGPAALMGHYRDARGRLHRGDPAMRDTPFLVGRPVDLGGWLRVLNPDSIREPDSNRLHHARQILQFFEPHQGFLDGMRQGSGRPYCRLPILFEKGLEADARPLLLLTESSLLLSHHAVACLESGQTPEAFNNLMTVFRLLDYCRQQPWLAAMNIEWEILANALQILWEGLDSRRWSAGQLEAIQQRLTTLQPLDRYAIAMRANAALFVDFVNRVVPVRDVGSTPRPLGSESSDKTHALAWIRWLYPKGWAWQDQAALARFYFQVALPLVDTDQRRLAPMDSIEIHTLLRSADPFFHVYLTPKLQLVLSDSWLLAGASQTFADLAALACGLERFHMVHGRYPATLDALPQQFLGSIPHDVLHGSPLAYRPLPDARFLLHTPGSDGADQSGLFPGVNNVSSGRRQPRDDLQRGDWVWSYPAR